MFSVASDTCVAMHQWVENPTAHTALDELLPCVDPATSQETLKRSKEVTSQLVEVVNSVTSNVSNINFGPQFRPFYYNQSGPLLPFICNPYLHDLTDRPCSRGEISLSNATEVTNYVCPLFLNAIIVLILCPEYFSPHKCERISPPDIPVPLLMECWSLNLMLSIYRNEAISDII